MTSGDAKGSWNYEAVAAAIEDCIYNEFKCTEIKYKNKVRSRISNLKVGWNVARFTRDIRGVWPVELSLWETVKPIAWFSLFTGCENVTNLSLTLVKPDQSNRHCKKIYRPLTIWFSMFTGCEKSSSTSARSDGCNNSRTTKRDEFQRDGQWRAQESQGTNDKGSYQWPPDGTTRWYQVGSFQVWPLWTSQYNIQSGLLAWFVSSFFNKPSYEP